MTRHRFLLSLLASLAFVGNADAATYYVDYTAGSDTNSGTSTAAAWRYAPGMSGYSGTRSLAPGDTVIFDRADTWPVGGGSQGFYLTGGVTYIGDSWGSGARARIRATSGFDAGVIRFRDHSTIPTVFQGFEVDANRQVANGIDINTGYWQLMNGATKRAVNNVVHGVYSQQTLGQYRYGIIVSNHGGTAGYAENVEIIDNVVYDISRDAICLYPGDENANTRIKNILVRGNQASNTGTDPGYCCGSGILVKGYVVDAVIEYNYLHNLKGASIFVNSNETNHFGNGPTNIHIRHNIVTNATQNGAILVYDGSGGSDPKDLKIYGNIVYNSTVGAGLLLHGGLVGTLQMRVYNNTFFNAPVRVENSSASYSTFEFTNNIVSYGAGTPLSDPGRKITLHSNNLFFRPSGTLVSSGGTNHTAATLSAYEPSAIGADPQFRNTANLPTGFSGAFSVDLAPNADGLAVLAGSPALNSGASLSAPFNTSVNTLARPVGASWDRGAYESGTGTMSPPTAPTNLRVIP